MTGVVSTTVLLCTAAGSFGVPAAAAPYPPTVPCALSWSQNSARGTVLVGSGYDTNQPVRVTLYPEAQALGSSATDAVGAFEVSVDVPHSAATWVTATSPHRSCSVVPPPPPGGSDTPSDGGSTPPVTGGSTTPGNPGTGTAAGSNGATSTNGAPGPGNGSAGSETGGGSGAKSTPAPSNRASSGSTGGSGTASTPSGTSPSQSASAARSAANADHHRTAGLGLPLSVIVTIAALLLLAGGLAVLFLTRRAG